MAENSNIELATHTFNPWRENNGTRVVAAESAWKLPLKWNRDAGAAMASWRACRAIIGDKGTGYPPERPRVFCASMADVFEDWRGPEGDGAMTCHKTGEPLSVNANGHVWPMGWPSMSDGDDWGSRPYTMADVRRRLFGLIDATPNLDWLVLTKRPENIGKMLPWARRGETRMEPAQRKNIWLGTSVEDQATADERIPHLLRVPAAVRFLSCEPLIEDLGTLDLTGIHLVIVGGESGPGARPMHPEWARSLRDQCQAAGVPFFFKQWGEWVSLGQSKECEIARENGHNPGFCPIGHDGMPVEGTSANKPGEVTVYKFGNKAAGRLLDGREWNEMPVVKEATS